MLKFVLFALFTVALFAAAMAAPEANPCHRFFRTTAATTAAAEETTAAPA